MARKPLAVEKYEFHALTPKRWGDFEQILGPNGCAGCWCMWYRLAHKDFTQAGKEGRREGLRTIVHSGFSPGIIAYADGIPAGWVALAPREWYARLKTSKHLAPVDDQPVWSITCFYIHRNYRRLGLMERLLQAAIEHARGQSATMLEAYPLDVEGKMSPVQLFSGKSSVFYKLGFEQVAMREYRPIVRLKL